MSCSTAASPSRAPKAAVSSSPSRKVALPSKGVPRYSVTVPERPARRAQASSRARMGASCTWARSHSSMSARARAATSRAKGWRQRSAAPTRSQRSTLGTETSPSTPTMGSGYVSPLARSERASWRPAELASASPTTTRSGRRSRTCARASLAALVARTSKPAPRSSTSSASRKAPLATTSTRRRSSAVMISEAGSGSIDGSRDTPRARSGAMNFRATSDAVTFSELLRDPACAPGTLATHLDGLDPAQRLREALALGAREQARLFELVAGARRFTLDDLCPANRPPLRGVAHEGRNSLYAFTRFAKLFAVPDVPGLEERWGYNRTSALVTTTVGPGYFVATAQGDEVLVDYRRLPARPLEGAPPVLDNAARLSLFVYHRTRDVVRGVSRHVSIGRAWRGERVLDNWFVLCRVDA